MEKADIQAHLMIMEPERGFDDFCASTKDIYENRYLLRELPYEDWIVNKVGSIILSAIRNKKRFRQLPCLKVLRSIVKNNYSPPLSRNTISILYEIYKQYIFSGKEDYEWCVSSLIKGRELKPEEIEWFERNWAKSNHIVNRLLRYPSNNLQVSSWAKERYENHELLDRKSEIIARFINDDFPNLLKNENAPGALAWAVYYSLVGIKEKEEMLAQIAYVLNDESIVKVCSRLNLPKPLKILIKAHHA